MRDALHLLPEYMKRVDIVLEIRDSQLPLASYGLPSNLMTSLAHRHRILILTRCDQAAVRGTALWRRHFREIAGPHVSKQDGIGGALRGHEKVVFLNSKGKTDVRFLYQRIQKTQAWRSVQKLRLR